MTKKFKRINGHFIHTLCEGGLVYRLGFVPEQVIGKELIDFLPKEVAIEKTNYYQRAWDGEKNVTYEAEVNGINYLVALRPNNKRGRSC